MSRLIDADAFKKEIGEDTRLRRIICGFIDEQPTAYDVEKVAEQLEELREEMKQLGADGILTDILEVVRSGRE